jgi:CheY-like chemotaxis protein
MLAIHCIARNREADYQADDLWVATREPRRHDQEVETEPVAPQLSTAPRARILVVDDERRIRLAIRACLEAEGYEVEEAADGRAAISAVVHDRPDLLLLDLSMPDLDGAATMRLLSTVYRDLAPPVVVLTAYGSIVAAESAYHDGARAFLEKPLVPETLRAVVAHVLAASRGGPSAFADEGGADA